MNISFYKGTGTPKNLVEGGIYFRTDKKIISLGIKDASSTAVKLLDFGGNVTNAEWDADSSTLTITKSDGSSFSIEHIADAEAVVSELKLRLGSVSAQTTANGGGAITVTETQGASSKSAVVGLKADNSGNVQFSQSAAGLKGTVAIPVTNVKEGHDIDVSSASGAFTINTALDNDITVMGVTVGNLTDKAKLTKGMTLSQILQQILVKEIDVYTQNPYTTMKITGAANGGTYEIGTSLSITPSHTYTDGMFKGDSGYYYVVLAGCSETGTTYYVDSTQQTASPFTISVTKNGNYTLNCKTTYGASTVTPKKNNGNNSTKTIAAGTATSGNLTINGRYYAYMGYSTATTGAAFDSAAIKALAAGKVWLNTSGNTTLVSAATSNGTSLIVACPVGYKLSAISNSLGVNILPNFDAPVEVNYTNGGVTTKYNVYVYPITSGAKVEYKGVTISKA